MDFGISVVPSDSEYTLEWASSNESILTVDSNGHAVAIGEGNVAVSCTLTFEDHSPITVTSNGAVAEPVITKVTIEPSRFEIQIGETQNLTLNVVPSNTNYTVVWESSNDSIATVNDGVVTAISSGNVSITARVTQKDKTFTARSTGVIEAQIIKATSIRTSESRVILDYYGEKATVDVFVEPSNATNKNNWKYDWNTVEGTRVLQSVKKVDSDTLTMTAWNEGQVLMTFSVDDVSTDVWVIVNNFAAEIWISQTSGSSIKCANTWVRQGSSQVLYVNTFPDDAVNRTAYSITIENPSIISVTKNQDAITITGLSVGETNMTVSLGNCSYTMPVSVPY